jgi:hypothetical protein
VQEFDYTDGHWPLNAKAAAVTEIAELCALFIVVPSHLINYESLIY